MFKDTCLIALKRIDRIPHILDLENPRTLDHGNFRTLNLGSLHSSASKRIILALKHTITQMQQS
jgi:hypothetical protein